MNHILIALLLLIQLPLAGEVDDDPPPEGYTFCGFDPEDFEEVDTIIPLEMGIKNHVVAEPDGAELARALFDGGPSTVVAGCVNAISGDLFESEVDFVIPGIEPLAVERTYSSKEGKWRFRYEPELQVSSTKGGHHVVAAYQDDCGFGLQFKEKVHRDNLMVPIPLNPSLYRKGLTNCGSGEISGQTDWINAKLLLLFNGKSKSYLFKTGGNVSRIFDRYESAYGSHKKGLSFGKFHLAKELHPNGNKLIFTYSELNKKNLVNVTVRNRKNLAISTLRITHGKHSKTYIGPSQTAKYRFDKNDRLQFVIASGRPVVEYAYDESGKMVCKKLPEGRELKISYYDHGHHKGKVSALYTPSGQDQTLVKTFTFHYEDDYTIVRDALGNSTTYRFDPDTKHLLSIAYPDGKVEKFNWTHSKSPLPGHLSGRKIYWNGEELFSKSIEYDSFGNITKETISGNLTGDGKSSYVKHFTSTQDGKNLPIEEKEGEKWIRSHYLSGTNLLCKRFTGTKETILKREFFKYDDNGATIEEILDDGLSQDEEDLSGITERHVKRITTTATHPIGLPEVVEDLYFDFENKAYGLLKKTRYTYSELGQVLEEAVYGSDGELAYTLKRNYDDQGRLIEESDALGFISTFAYDALGNKIEEKNPQQVKRFSYDFSNRMVKEEELGPNGEWLTTHHTYDLLGRRLTTIDPNGDRIEYSYDALGRVLAKTFHLPDAASEAYTYDPFGYPSSRQDPEGCCTKTIYTMRGQPALIHHPDGTFEKKRYAPDGLLIQECSPTGMETEFEYDLFGRVQKKRCGQRETISQYTVFHLLQEQEKEGKAVSYKYDGAGRVIQKIDEDKTTTYAYDRLGREHVITEGERVTIKYYDLKGQIVEERVEDLAKTLLSQKRYAYDFLGNQIKVEVGPYCKKMQYSPQGKLMVEEDGLGHVTTYSYSFAPCKEIRIDANGNKEEKVFNGLDALTEYNRFDPFNNLVLSERYFYDRCGRKIKAIAKRLPTEDEETIAWAYDSMGRLISIVQAPNTPLQRLTEIIYNALGQKEKVRLPSGDLLHYTYDTFDRMDRIYSSDGTVDYKITYDSLDRVIREYDAVNNSTTERSYDLHGRVKVETLGNGLSIYYSYDSQDRICSILLPDESAIAYSYDAAFLKSVSKEGSYTHTYDSYNLAGQLEKETFINGMQARLSYDITGRLNSFHSLNLTETIQYDFVGNAIKRQLREPTSSLEFTYHYDALDQLTEENGAQQHTYNYDALLNRIAKDGSSLTINSLNHLTSSEASRYTYDLNGNLIGKQTGSDKTIYLYDALSRLISIETNGKKTNYTYDYSGRRLSKAQGETETAFLYVHEIEIASFQKGKILELRVPGLHHEAIAMELKGSHCTPFHDFTGNLVKLFDGEKLLETNSISAFGEAFTSSCSPWSFSGKRHDKESGLYYFGKRYYDPETGRFITQDPLGYEDGLNLYAYVHNRPLTHHDPDGQFAFLIPIALSLAAEYAVPFAAVALQEAGFIGAAAFATGLVQGYNGSLFEESALESLDPTSSYIGKALGCALSLANPRKGLTNCARTLAAKEGSIIATNVATKTATKWSSSLTKKAALKPANRTDSAFQRFALTRNEIPIDKLAKKGMEFDRQGLTRAGRALDKHGNRPPTIFPKAMGNVEMKNLQGQFVLEEILTDPKSIILHNGVGFDIISSRGRGANFYYNGHFRGFTSFKESHSYKQLFSNPIKVSF